MGEQYCTLNWFQIRQNMSPLRGKCVLVQKVCKLFTCSHVTESNWLICTSAFELSIQIPIMSSDNVSQIRTFSFIEYVTSSFGTLDDMELSLIIHMSMTLCGLMRGSVSERSLWELEAYIVASTQHNTRHTGWYHRVRNIRKIKNLFPIKAQCPSWIQLTWKWRYFIYENGY